MKYHFSTRSVGWSNGMKESKEERFIVDKAKEKSRKYGAHVTLFRFPIISLKELD